MLGDELDESKLVSLRCNCRYRLGEVLVLSDSLVKVLCLLLEVPLLKEVDYPKVVGLSVGRVLELLSFV